MIDDKDKYPVEPFKMHLSFVENMQQQCKGKTGRGRGDTGSKKKKRKSEKKLGYEMETDTERRETNK